ncbi:MAG TPA: hypothetical protein VFC71_03730 [Candidatus Polarisedimenticolia bacterium]|nr:hypothetical protein [Candidatus Polarisedimenticolia bacterium]
MRGLRPFALALLLAACTPSASPSSTQLPTPSPSSSPAGSPTAPPSNAQGVVIDSSLLGVLPAEVDGLALAESPEAEAQGLSDPELGEVADAIAAAFALDPATNDYVYAAVIHLKPRVMGDERFRDWRDSFDEGACSQAGGVAGHAETEIDGRTVYIGTCAGGVRTYHVWLAEQNLIVSASAVGEERRLGEKLVENLRP